MLVVDPYGLTATTAASSLEGWCREVTVTVEPTGETGTAGGTESEAGVELLAMMPLLRIESAVRRPDRRNLLPEILFANRSS